MIRRRAPTAIPEARKNSGRSVAIPSRKNSGRSVTIPSRKKIAAAPGEERPLGAAYLLGDRGVGSLFKVLGEC
jgi:hypothetical protein